MDCMWKWIKFKLGVLWDKEVMGNLGVCMRQKCEWVVKGWF